MKKIIGTLLVTSIIGITSLFACPHTWDGSDCEFCVAPQIDQALDTIDKVENWISDYAECVTTDTVVGAGVGAALAGPGGAAVTGAAAFGYGLYDCFEKDPTSTFKEAADNVREDKYYCEKCEGWYKEKHNHN